MVEGELDPLIGIEVAGRYRVVRRIGRGGMGSIYEVHHTRLDKSFAMKTLSWEVAQDTESVARFQREADVIAKLRHPHIVEIVDWDTLRDGTPCLIMEHLRGEDLSRRIRTVGPLRWNLIAQFADQVLSALVVAHQQGVVHRDLKPQNIFLAVDDAGEERAKLLDFGVSKITGQQSLTTESRLIGTPSYMAPEQAEGQQDAIGEHTDVWAMGAILFEMATGKAAFEGTNLPAILYKIVHGEPAKLVDNRVDAPAAFVELVERCLTRDPALRVTRIHTLRTSLRRALGVLPGVVYAETLRAQTPPAGVPTSIALSPTVSSGDNTPPPMDPIGSDTTLSKTAAESFGARAVASPLAQPRPKRAWIIAAGAACAVAAAIVIVLATRTGSQPVHEPGAEIDASVAVRVPIDAAPVPAIDAAPPVAITHTIRSVPAGASVLRDKDPLGSTPLVGIAVAPGRAEVVYVVEKSGFVRETVRLDTTKTQDVTVQLRRIGKPDPKPGSAAAGSGSAKPPPETPKSVPCRKKGELPNPFEKRPPCPD